MFEDKRIKELIEKKKLVDLDTLTAEEKDDLFARIGPCSLDVRLGNEIYLERHSVKDEFAMARAISEQRRNILAGGKKATTSWKNYKKSEPESPFYKVDIGSSTPTNPFPLRPQELILGATLTTFVFPDNVVGQLTMRSTWMRRGLNHGLAALFDAGVGGGDGDRGLNPTLELINELSHFPLEIYAGARVAQIMFSYTEDFPIKPYHVLGNYNNDKGPKLARNYEKAGEF